MPDRTFLDWPFCDDAHRALAAELEPWAAREVPAILGEGVTEADVRSTFGQ